MQNDIEEIIKKAADDGRLVILTADSIEAMTAAPLRRVMPLCKQFQLSGAEGRLLARLVQHGRATKEELHPICSNRASPGKAKSLVGVIIHKLRRKVAPAGIEIVTVRDTGFELPAASREKIRELLGERLHEDRMGGVAMRVAVGASGGNAMNVIPMKVPNDTIMLRGFQVDLKNDVGRQFVRDCARNIEGLICDGDIMLKYGLSPKDWGDIRTNQTLLRAIQAEHTRRVLNNIQLQEGSAKILSDAPRMLGDILTNNLSNPRHKIEAFKALGQTALAGKEGSIGNKGELFTIRINVGEEGDPANVFFEFDPTEKRGGGDNNESGEL